MDELLEVKLSEITWPDETDVNEEQIKNMAKGSNDLTEPLTSDQNRN